MASTKGGKVWSEFWQVGLEADAWNTEGLEKAEGPGVGANNAELPWLSYKVQYEIVGEEFVAVICESEDKGAFRSDIARNRTNKHS